MTFVLEKSIFLGGGLAHRLDALGAKHLAHGVALYHHKGLLQVRFELAVGGSLGEGATVSKGCGFSTICAFSHLRTFLSCYNSE